MQNFVRYLNSMNIFQQLIEGLEMSQRDQLSAGALFSLSIFVDGTSRGWQLQVTVFLEKKRKKCLLGLTVNLFVNYLTY